MWHLIFPKRVENNFFFHICIWEGLLIRFKFTIELIDGDLKKWQSFDQQIAEKIKMYQGSNLIINYEKNYRFVSVCYPSLNHLNDAVKAIEKFFNEKGLTQKRVGFATIDQIDSEEKKTLKKALNALESVNHG
jgi:hypothetical protein